MNAERFAPTISRRLKLGAYRYAWPLVRRLALRRRGMSLVAFAAGCLRPGDVVFDVGANSGYFSRVFAAAVGPRGHVHAFEPNPAFEGELQRAAAEYRGNITPVRAALSDHAGRAEFFVDTRPDGYGSTFNGAVARQWADAKYAAIEVSCSTLDQFCAQHGLAPAFVKLDVEGGESAVIAGGMGVLRQARPLLWFECASTGGLEHLSRLNELGYHLFLGNVLGRDGEWIARSDPRNPRHLLPLDATSLAGVSAVLDLAAIPRERLEEVKPLLGSETAGQFLSMHLDGSKTS